MGIDVDVELEYTVVINKEEQYSIWPTIKELPNGWVKCGVCGKKKECLEYIKDVWKDMRPLSLRKRIEERQKELDVLVSSVKNCPTKSIEDSSLVKFLLEGQKEFKLHPNELSTYTVEEFVRREVMHIELSFGAYETYLRLNVRHCSDLKNIDYSNQMKFTGYLDVDFTHLFCSGWFNYREGVGSCNFKRSMERE